MNTKRLTILRDALIEHAKNPGNLKFDLRSWAVLPAKYRHANADEAVQGAALGRNFCGTAACAMGFATTIPAFRKAGLGLVTATRQGSGTVTCAISLHGQSRDGFTAACDLFDIEYIDAEELFSSLRYPVSDAKNPIAVADKITALLHTA